MSGEQIAVNFLIAKKYRIIDRNFREKFGEIDIIAKDDRGVLVFVEVKALNVRVGDNLKPEDNLTVAKYFKLKKICEYYANLKKELVDEKLGWRIDLIALTISGENCHLKHYKNITP